MARVSIIVFLMYSRGDFTRIDEVSFIIQLINFWVLFIGVRYNLIFLYVAQDVEKDDMRIFLVGFMDCNFIR